jgi:hypothetical protein
VLLLRIVLVLWVLLLEDSLLGWSWLELDLAIVEGPE